MKAKLLAAAAAIAIIASGVVAAAQEDPKQAADRVEPKLAPKAEVRTAQHDAAHGQPKVIGSVKSSQEHATRIGEALQKHREREHAGIDINVGVRVPDGVTVYPLPGEVIAVAPEFRGYDYFIDDNNEVVFVSPETHEIVGAIEYEERAAAD